MLMTQTKNYFFEDKRKIVAYVFNALSHPTPIKVQKTLYFIWAFYSGTYGNIDYNTESEFDMETRYPKYLFKPNFEAWKYGPVDNEVYSWEKSGEINKLDNSFDPKTAQEREIKSFIDDMISQVDAVNDFGLVSRSHEDLAYRESYKEGVNHSLIDSNKIKRDYVEYVKKQSDI